ncbi:GNAT family N-acetyltransferase [Fulvimarina sp. 2208YS6-2-32]|uniref:GNAT family N-acetyltransferase n=1 Tax=Fulvimarina uroteuthidis TaxID=3098149 RepID=A0ABU5I3Y6_9HYPH|nr:GNAT family N-acetyltransferase [Fulvimarina sp. 2208YS6-2-32]MDY8109478.1 GNAT family N-acetyltransferase [Fulvimarina sp. 2208YS6-2-32]
MDIEHEPGTGGGRFVTSGGASELTYRRRDEETVVFDHTFVPPAERGNGIAAKLVDAGVAWARAERVKIVPQCPYVDVLFKRNPQRYADVVAG